MKVLREKMKATKIEICTVAKLRPGTVESVLKTYLRPRNFIVMKHEGFGKNKKTFYSLGSESGNYRFSDDAEVVPFQKDEKEEGQPDAAQAKDELQPGMVRVELTNVRNGIHLKFEGPSSKLDSFLSAFNLRDVEVEKES
jgi:hypothetical protein